MQNSEIRVEKMTLKQRVFIVALFLLCVVIAAGVLLYFSPAKTTVGNHSWVNGLHSEDVRLTNA